MFRFPVVNLSFMLALKSVNRCLFHGLTEATAMVESALMPPSSHSDETRRCTTPPGGREVSRFPDKERPHVLGSLTTPGRAAAGDGAAARIAFHRSIANLIVAQGSDYALG